MTNELVDNPNVVYEEDIEVALAKCVSMLGKLGRMIYKPGKKVYYDAVLEHDKYGKLWYGDLEADLQSEDMERLASLATEIGHLTVAAKVVR